MPRKTRDAAVLDAIEEPSGDVLEGMKRLHAERAAEDAAFDRDRHAAALSRYSAILQHADHPRPSDPEELSAISADLGKSAADVAGDLEVIRQVGELEEAMLQRDGREQELLRLLDTITPLRRKQEAEMLAARRAVEEARSNFATAADALSTIKYLAGQRPWLFNGDGQRPRLRS